MRYRTEKQIVDEKGKIFKVGDEVSVTYNAASGYEGGGFGGATITKITDTGFQYTQGCNRIKSVQYKNIKKIQKRED